MRRIYTFSNSRVFELCEIVVNKFLVLHGYRLLSLDKAIAFCIMKSLDMFHRYRAIWIILLFMIKVDSNRSFDHIPPWIVSLPASFVETITAKGKMLDVRSNADDISFQRAVSNINLERIDGNTDGEMVDALEHFFWGLKNGIALELGAADGSAGTSSMTVGLQESLGWERVLIEGNSEYREDLVGYSPEAVVINAAICKNSSQLHFVSAPNGGGILEFMSKEYLQYHHPNFFEAGSPNGSLNNIKWPLFSKVKEVKCLTLSKVVHFLRLRNVNFFVLDVAVSGKSFSLAACISLVWY